MVKEVPCACGEAHPSFAAKSTLTTLHHYSMNFIIGLAILPIIVSTSIALFPRASLDHERLVGTILATV